MRRSTWDLNDEPTILRLVLRFLINAVAVWVASRLIPGITPLNTLSALLLVTLIFGVANALIKPVFSLLTCPLQILTLGLFTLIINAIMLGLSAWVSQQLAIPFAIDGFFAAFLGALVISVVSWALSGLV